MILLSPTYSPSKEKADPRRKSLCRAYHPVARTTSPVDDTAITTERCAVVELTFTLNCCARIEPLSSSRTLASSSSVCTHHRSISHIPIPRRTKPRWHSRFPRYWWAFLSSFRSFRVVLHTVSFYFTITYTFISRPRRCRFLREHPASRWRRQLTNCLERLLYYTEKLLARCIKNADLRACPVSSVVCAVLNVSVFLCSIQRVWCVLLCNSPSP